MARRSRRAALPGALFVVACATTQPPRVVAPSISVLAPTRAVLPLDAELATRVERVTEAFSARGAIVADTPWSGFLREGAPEGFTLAIDRSQCVGLAAVGPEGMGNLDLVVLGATGTELARDDRPDAHPFVRVCVREPSALRVFVRAVRGNGQVAAMVMAAPPLLAPPLSTVLATPANFVPTGPRIPRGDIGREPTRLPPPEFARRLTAAQREMGWAELGAMLEGTLHHQEVTTRDFNFAADACYLLQGAGGEGVDDLDLVVHGPEGAVVAQDLALDAQPVVRVCATRAGVHRVEVRMYSGEGAWALSTLTMPEPRTPPAAGLDPVARARWTEAALEAEARGMSAVLPPVRGVPWGALAQSITLPVTAGRCYLAAAAGDGQVAALDLWIADAAGAVVASDTAERERATVFHCATRSGRATLTVRTANARGTWVLQAFQGGGAS